MTTTTPLPRPRAATVKASSGTRTIPTDSPLLRLGRRIDAVTERGVVCPGDLPSPNDPTLLDRVAAAKATLGDRVMILGHHYQRDQVIEHADTRGDSFKLAQDASTATAEFIIFCGVHFMAESA
ncbi:MAG: quinolinate synthase, partial [Myxococcota bacterium]